MNNLNRIEDYVLRFRVQERRARLVRFYLFSQRFFLELRRDTVVFVFDMLFQRKYVCCFVLTCCLRENVFFLSV